MLCHRIILSVLNAFSCPVLLHLRVCMWVCPSTWASPDPRIAMRQKEQTSETSTMHVGPRGGSHRRVPVFHAEGGALCSMGLAWPLAPSTPLPARIWKTSPSCFLASQRRDPHQILCHHSALGWRKGRSNPSPFQLRHPEGRGALIHVPLPPCSQTSLQITVKDLQTQKCYRKPSCSDPIQAWKAGPPQ